MSVQNLTIGKFPPTSAGHWYVVNKVFSAHRVCVVDPLITREADNVIQKYITSMFAKLH